MPCILLWCIRHWVQLISPVFCVFLFSLVRCIFLRHRLFTVCVLGTNVQEAKRILSESGLPIVAANDLEDAAKKAVAAIAKK